MRYTFKPDDCMVISIPLKSIRSAGAGQLMPDKFTCRFKDNYKVYQSGHPKAFGVAQIVITAFIVCLGGILFTQADGYAGITYSLPSILHLVSGGLAVAAAHTPLMPLMKVSFFFNVMGLAVDVVMAIFMCLHSQSAHGHVSVGVNVVVVVLYIFQFLLSVILIHWESKAVCRSDFNSLPMIILQQDR